MASDRIFNPSGRRHHRPRYSPREWRYGLLVLALLAVVVGWVFRRGAHPDPGLFALPDSLLTAVAAKGPSALDTSAPGAPAAGAALAPDAAGAASPALDASAPAAGVSHDPFPADVTAGGWAASGPVESFGPNNAYVKIDGRDEFYKAFGLRSLACLSLAGPGGAGAIDLELFHLGSAADAAGALLAEAGERAASVVMAGGALRRESANAGYLARADRYLRVLGADGTPATRAEVVRLLDRVGRALPPGELPWAFALFGGRLGVPPSRITYQGEDAFSFAFARAVYSAAYVADGGEWFVTRADAFAGGPPALAERFAEGFASYGEREAPLALPGGARAAAVRDRYLGKLAAVVAAPPFVAGVRLARDRDEAGAQLARLLTELRGLDLPAAAAAAGGVAGREGAAAGGGTRGQ